MTSRLVHRLLAGLGGCAETAPDLRSLLVGLRNEVRVDVQRRRRVPVPQTTGHGPYIDAGAQQSGGAT